MHLAPTWGLTRRSSVTPPLAAELEHRSDPLRHVLKVAKGVAIPRDKIALAVLDVGQGSEAVNFQLENVIVGIEWVRTAGKPHRGKFRGGGIIKAVLSSGYSEQRNLTFPRQKSPRYPILVKHFPAFLLIFEQPSSKTDGDA